MVCGSSSSRLRQRKGKKEAEGGREGDFRGSIDLSVFPGANNIIIGNKHTSYEYLSIYVPRCLQFVVQVRVDTFGTIHAVVMRRACR